MAIARPAGPGVLTLHDIQMIRATYPDHSFSGAYVTPDAYQWLTTNRPGTAYPAMAPTPNPVMGALPPAEQAAPPPPEAAAPTGINVVDYIGGAGAGAAPSYDPNTDPTFQQLMRQLALQETNYRTQASTAQAQAQENAAILSPRVLQSGIQARQGINNQFEEHGTFRSGLRLNDLALERQKEQQKLADIQRQAATSVAATNTALNTNLGDLANQRANAQLQANLRAGGAAAGGSTVAAVA